MCTGTFLDNSDSFTNLNPCIINQASIHENVSGNEYQAKRNPIMHAILNALIQLFILTHLLIRCPETLRLVNVSSERAQMLKSSNNQTVDYSSFFEFPSQPERNDQPIRFHQLVCLIACNCNCLPPPRSKQGNV